MRENYPSVQPLIRDRLTWLACIGFPQPMLRPLKSYIAENFPLGITNITVKSGQLLGYQGSWSGNSFWPKWVHISFTVLDESGHNNFPEKVFVDTVLDPIPYLGLTLETCNENPQPLKSEQP